MVSQVWKQLRLDVTTVVSSVLGHPPPPLVQRRPSRARALAHVEEVSRPAVQLGRPLRIDEVVPETEDTVSLVLADPSGAPIDFEPGQFFTLVVPVEGELLRRAYSASSQPGALGGRVRVSVKRMPGGKVSTKLVTSARPGDVLTVLGPSGSFVPTPAESQESPRRLLLVAGGSGITPILSIARTLLDREPRTRVTLLYGNRRERDIPFRAELEGLAAEHEGRFALRLVLSEPESDWRGGVGLLTRDVLELELAALGEAGTLDPSSAASAAYLCGPEPMMQAAREVLRARRVPDERIHQEVFASPVSAEARVAPATPVEVTFSLGGVKKRAIQRVGMTLLEAGLEAGLDMPYSCAMGGCGACKVHLLSGETTHDGGALTPSERRAGYVLACSDRATSPCEIEVRR